MNAQEQKKEFEAMLSMCAKHGWRPNYYCTVTSVDRDARTCELEATSGATSFPDADLCAAQSDADDHIVLYPKVGSVVLVEIVEGQDTHAVVTKVTEVEEIDIVIGQTTINIKDGLIKMNGGNNDGLVLVNPMVSIVNELQKDLNNGKDAMAAVLNSMVNTGAPGAPDVFQTAMKTGLTGWLSQRLVLTQKDDIQNKKITQ